MNIGLLGFGVVGRGVYDMLAGRDNIRAAWVLCRRDLGELTARTTYEMQDILDAPANSPRAPKSTAQRCGARQRSAAASRA